MIRRANLRPGSGMKAQTRPTRIPRRKEIVVRMDQTVRQRSLGQNKQLVLWFVKRKKNGIKKERRGFMEVMERGQGVHR